jgi:hypothetical protein
VERRPALQLQLQKLSFLDCLHGDDEPVPLPCLYGYESVLSVRHRLCERGVLNIGRLFRKRKACSSCQVKSTSTP